MIKVGVVDDKLVNRKIILDKLSKDERFTVTLQAVDGSDFLEQIKQLDIDEQPEIVLMDLEMPNVNGITAVAAASVIYPQIKFVMLTIYDDEDKIFNAIKAGAHGYLLKDDSSARISDMLWRMYENNEGAISSGIAYKILQMLQNEKRAATGTQGAENTATALFQLSEREQGILQLLVQGNSYREIGEKLFISANTAKKHVMNIYSKLHINSKADAVRIVYEKKLFE